MTRKNCLQPIPRTNYGPSLWRLSVTKVRTDPLARFERLYTKDGIQDCWLWKKPIPSYPHFWVPGEQLNTGGYVIGNRFSWMIYRSPIPNGKSVLHTCDNKRCVNPNHLYLGTQKENNRDRYARGRDNRANGEKIRSSKFTADQVRFIRDSKESVGTLAKQFGVWHSAISKIKLRQRWQHIPEEK